MIWLCVGIRFVSLEIRYQHGGAEAEARFGVRRLPGLGLLVGLVAKKTLSEIRTQWGPLTSKPLSVSW